MRYAFIINPASGNGRKAEALEKTLRALEKEPGRDIRIYRTSGEKDATVLADQIAKEAALGGEEVSVYACGGDGTIQEVVNGLIGHENALLGLIPTGSGNDFVRCFSHPEYFQEPVRQLDAPEMLIDVMECTMEMEGGTRSFCYINGINIGFDGNTAILAHSLKELPLVSGTASYILALAVNLIQKKGENLRVIADGREVHNGPLILATAANGRFCGGGFESCPKALLDNGLIELLVVRDITRRYFLKVVPKFKAGRLFEVPNVQEIATSLQAREVRIEPKTGTMKFVADGEIVESGAITVRVKPKAMRVLVPGEEDA